MQIKQFQRPSRAVTTAAPTVTPTVISTVAPTVTEPASVEEAEVEVLEPPVEHLAVESTTAIPEVTEVIETPTIEAEIPAEMDVTSFETIFPEAYIEVKNSFLGEKKILLKVALHESDGLVEFIGTKQDGIKFETLDSISEMVPLNTGDLLELTLTENGYTFIVLGVDDPAFVEVPLKVPTLVETIDLGEVFMEIGPLANTLIISEGQIRIFMDLVKDKYHREDIVKYAVKAFLETLFDESNRDVTLIEKASVEAKLGMILVGGKMEMCIFVNLGGTLPGLTSPYAPIEPLITPSVLRDVVTILDDKLATMPEEVEVEKPVVVSLVEQVQGTEPEAKKTDVDLPPTWATMSRKKKEAYCKENNLNFRELRKA